MFPDVSGCSRKTWQFAIDTKYCDGPSETRSRPVKPGAGFRLPEGPRCCGAAVLRCKCNSSRIPRNNLRIVYKKPVRRAWGFLLCPKYHAKNSQDKPENRKARRQFEQFIAYLLVILFRLFSVCSVFVHMLLFCLIIWTASVQITKWCMANVDAKWRIQRPTSNNSIVSREMNLSFSGISFSGHFAFRVNSPDHRTDETCRQQAGIANWRGYCISEIETDNLLIISVNLKYDIEVSKYNGNFAPSFIFWKRSSQRKIMSMNALHSFLRARQSGTIRQWCVQKCKERTFYHWKILELWFFEKFWWVPHRVRWSTWNRQHIVFVGKTYIVILFSQFLVQWCREFIRRWRLCVNRQSTRRRFRAQDRVRGVRGTRPS